MNNIERYILRWILRRLINQGVWYGSNIREIYRMVRIESNIAFPEDNEVTRYEYLLKQFNNS